MEVRFRLPSIPSGLFGNLLGLLGMLAFAVCAGGFLASLGVPGSWWVTGILAAVELFALSWVASAHADAVADATVKALTAPTQKLRPVTAAVARSA